MPTKRRKLLTQERFEELRDLGSRQDLLDELSAFVQEKPGRKPESEFGPLSDSDRQRRHRKGVAQTR